MKKNRIVNALGKVVNVAIETAALPIKASWAAADVAGAIIDTASDGVKGCKRRIVKAISKDKDEQI